MEELENKKVNKLMVFMFGSLALGLVSTITYLLYNIVTKHSLFTIISGIILVIFAFDFIYSTYYPNVSEKIKIIDMNKFK